MTPLLIVALIIGAVIQYRKSTDELESRFNERQMHLTREAADRLDGIFRTVSKSLMLLGHVDEVVSLQRGGNDTLTTIVAQLTEHGALCGGLRDGEGRLVLGSGRHHDKIQDLFAKLPICGTVRDVCLTGPVRWNLSPSGRVLIVASRTAKPVAPTGRPARQLAKGEVFIVLDWGSLGTLVNRVTHISPQTSAWVLDDRGNLIMHPEHRRQLGKDVKREKSCSQCHTSFEVHDQMVSGRSGIGRLQIKGRPLKLVAFSPFNVGKKRWSVGVATPAKLAIAGGRKALFDISLFTAAIMLVMIIGAVLLDRESSRRIAAAASFSHDLERKVNERTAEIKALYGRLAELQAHHTRLERTAVVGEMASIVAHEVRTPLNALSINAQRIGRLLRRKQPGDAEKIQEILVTLEGEIARINALLEEHLLSQVRDRPVECKRLDLNEIVTDSVRFIEPEAVRHQIALRTTLGGDLPLVCSDGAKLRQILLNIMLNAIQAMPDGGDIEVRTGRGDGTVNISVRDNGPGIAGLNGDPDRVFRPFVTTKEDGTGLGLAICARLVKKMGGTIELESTRGEGATFTVTLPEDLAGKEPCP